MMFFNHIQNQKNWILIFIIYLLAKFSILKNIWEREQEPVKRERTEKMKEDITKNYTKKGISR